MIKGTHGLQWSYKLTREIAKSRNLVNLMARLGSTAE